MTEQTSNQSDPEKRRLVNSGKRRLVKLGAVGLVSLTAAFGLAGMANAAVIGSIHLTNEGGAASDATSPAALEAALNACKEKYGDQVQSVQWTGSQGGFVNYYCKDTSD
jgi:hypothetical protein